MDSNFKKRLVGAKFDDIIGQEDVKKAVKSALLMDRHILLVGQPGIGKTTLARSIAKIIDDKEVNDCPYHCDPARPICPICRSGEATQKVLLGGESFFVRVQGSPDLTAEDLIGDIDPAKALKHGASSIDAFTPGKIFRANQGILFFDEVNRCTEKLQNTLLQALEEGRVTLGSYTVDIPVNFLFIGTMNPEDTSTEPLSDVFLDRFDLIEVGYPENTDIELEIVTTHGKKILEFPDDLLRTVVDFIRGLRYRDDVQKKPSVRASIGVYERAQSNAAVNGRQHVTMQDVKEVMVSVLAHRIKLKPSIKYLTTPEQYIEQHFQELIDRGDYL
ncbi:MAG: AAA family ATPase [Nanoarchaeota archaeon]